MKILEGLTIHSTLRGVDENEKDLFSYGEKSYGEKLMK